MLKRVKEGKRTYCESVLALDIETTIYNNKGIVYSIAVAIDYDVYVFRKVKDLMYFLDLLAEQNEGVKVIIYVHNLSYEWQFLKNYFTEIEKVICVSNAKDVLTFTYKNLEFRCFAKLTNSKLAKLAGKTDFEKPKDFDYKLIRHSETKLTEEEMKYIRNDVLIIVDYFNKVYRPRYGTPEQTPYTSTGITRREVKERSKLGDPFELLDVQAVSVSSAELARQIMAFQGGFTHANPSHSCRVVPEVNSVDLTSAYPAAMVAHEYPMLQHSQYSYLSLEKYLKLIEKFCVIATFTFTNMVTKDNVNFISKHKIINSSGALYENGKLYMADSVTVTATEIDYTIFKQAYNWEDVTIEDVYVYRKGKLPKYLVDVIIEKYKDKTKLKGVKGREIDYAMSKSIINGMYGMCCSNPVRKNYRTVMDDGITYIISEEDDLVEDLRKIDKYNRKRSRTTVYLWGAYITAYVRQQIINLIYKVGVDNWVYSDTDSCKVLLSRTELDSIIKEENDKIKSEMKEAAKYYGYTLEDIEPKDIKGNKHFLGLWENEIDNDGEYKYELFKTLGAKRYMVKENGSLEITVSGLSKKAVSYFEQFDNPFDRFCESIAIPAKFTNKLMKKYRESPITEIEVTDYQGNVCTQEVSGGLELYESDFHVDVAVDYAMYVMNEIKTVFEEVL